MMAVEPTIAIETVEASAPTNAAQITTHEQTPQDGASEAARVNGEAFNQNHTEEIDNKLISDIVDDLVNSTEVSVSGGSDNEATKPDTRQDGESKGHVRTASTKKPISFKSVSVNKTFLAAKGASSNAAPKIGDKPAATPAASGTTTASSAPVFAKPRLVAKMGMGLSTKAAATTSRTGAVPDAGAVWNKNKPPEPKKYTDEELKKYGIHMATRLGPEDSKGQANWADIDDDDEDWAPEAITWADGTKMEMKPEEVIVAPVEVPTQIPQDEPSRVRIAKPEPPRAGSMVPLRMTGLPSGRGLVLKGAPEKPTLVAKPPAPPAAVKSPWATLPPVDKASPVVTDIRSAHPQRGSFSSGTPQHVQGPPPPLPPTKEIAADDFSRSDGLTHGRGLFNSQSGRYEPAPERKGAHRGDSHSRQPALLQRGSISEGHPPAEPSAGFQTNHTSASYGRRRGSSNVSGGSGLLGQRQGKPYEPVFLSSQDGSNGRRGSAAAGSVSPVSHGDYSPAAAKAQHQAWNHRQSPAVSHSGLQPGQPADVNNAAVAPPSVEDVNKYQAELMKKSREAARKRKEDEEARLEAEKQERLAKKLAALGPAPESRSARKDAPAKAAAVSTEDDDKVKATHAAQSDNLGISSKSDANVTQENSAAAASLTNGVKILRQSSQNDARVNNTSLPKRDTNVHLPAQQQSIATGGNNQHPPPPSKMARDLSPWSTAQSTLKSVWSSAGQSLGNGTFDSTVTRDSPTKQVNLQSSPVTLSNATMASDLNSTRLPPIGPPASQNRPTSQSQPTSVPLRSAADTQRNAWAAVVQANDRQDEEDRRRAAAERGREPVVAHVQDTWKPTQLDSQGRRVVQDARQQTVQSAPAPPQPAVNPWGVASNTVPRQDPPTRPVAAASPAQPNGNYHNASQPPRSRFFPTKMEEQASMPEPSRSTSPSPPPPDMAGHPAFDGDTARPTVQLPKVRPVVKLPPSMSPPAAPTPSHEVQFAWATPRPFDQANMTHKNQPAPKNMPHTEAYWQDKINVLTKHDQNKPMAVEASTRLAMGHSTQNTFAHVSLPSMMTQDFVARGRSGADERAFTTRIMAENCFEEQEMGSLPPVRIPKVVPIAAWEPASAAPRLDRRFMITALTGEAFVFQQEHSGANKLIWVQMPGLKNRSSVSTPAFNRTHSSPRRGTRGGQRFASSGHRGGHVSKSRDAPAVGSGNTDRAVSTSVTGASNTPTRGGRGGYRGGRGGGIWNRESPAATPTPISTW